MQEEVPRGGRLFVRMAHEWEPECVLPRCSEDRRSHAQPAAGSRTGASRTEATRLQKNGRPRAGSIAVRSWRFSRRRLAVNPTELLACSWSHDADGVDAGRAW